MKTARVIMIYFAAALAAAVCGMLFGATRVPLNEFVQDGALNPIVELRIVRTASAAVVGASLAVSGLVFQAVLRNALAEPFLLGVSGGAGLGAAAAVDGVTVDNDLGSPAPEVSLWKTPFRGGIAEDFISTRALVKKYPAPGAKEIADAAQNGDASALQVWREFGECLAELLSQWIARWDLERVALGGQIAKAWELFRAPLDSLPVHPARLPEAALYGAFSRARDLLGSRN